MRRLVLLAFVALVAFPLSARGYGHRSRRVVVMEDGCRPSRDWDNERWEHYGYGHRGHYSRQRDCDEDRIVYGVRPLPIPRPLAPPFQGRVELWIR